MRYRWLVVGMGNTLRRDDGIGPWLATQIDAWNLAHVRVRIVFSLTPELAADAADADSVLFLDACQAPAGPPWREIPRRRVSAAVAHALSPESLLDLTNRLFGACPAGWVLPVQGFDFAFGEGLSDSALGEAQVALEWLDTKLREPESAFLSDLSSVRRTDGTHSPHFR